MINNDAYDAIVLGWWMLLLIKIPIITAGIWNISNMRVNKCKDDGNILLLLRYVKKTEIKDNPTINHIIPVFINISVMALISFPSESVD